MNDEFPDRRRPDLAGLGACAATIVEPFPTPIESHSTGQGMMLMAALEAMQGPTDSAVRSRFVEILYREMCKDYPDKTWGSKMAAETINGEAKP